MLVIVNVSFKSYSEELLPFLHIFWKPHSFVGERWRRESAGTALGILFGNFVLSSVIGSKTTYYISDISMSEAIGIVSGLYLSSGKNHKTAKPGKEKTDANINRYK